MLEKEQLLLIIYFVVIILFVVVFLIVFTIAFQKRKNKLLLAQVESKKQYEDELSRAKIEIQEQTLKNVSWELHDNIGQLLSTAVMHINMLKRNHPHTPEEPVDDIRELVSTGLQEIRSLSKTLNSEVIQNIGLEKSIRLELQRFEKLNFLETELVVLGDPVEIKPNDEIILYRILQEFLSNTIKHAEAEHLSIMLDFRPEELYILCKDDGIGYDMNTVQANSGLLNIQSRAQLIKATAQLDSTLGQGVTLELQYPIPATNNKQHIHSTTS